MLSFGDYFLFLLLTMVKIASFNVNGLRDIDKFTKVIKVCDAEIICIQETHWDTDCETKCKKKWPGFYFSSHGTQRARGVSIMVSSQIEVDATLIDKDSRGRWVKVGFVFEDTVYKLLNIYAPNNERERTSFFQELNMIAKDCDIIVGDFNVKMCRLDFSSDCSYKQDSSRAALKLFMDNNNLCDLWRTRNPVTREYSRVQPYMDTIRQSRIDFCLVKKPQIDFFNTVRYCLNFISDHAILHVEMGVKRKGRGGGVWQFNASLLSRRNYVDCISKLISFECSQPEFGENIVEGWEKLKVRIKQKSIQFAKKLNFKTREKERSLRNTIVKLNAQPVVDVERLVNIQNEIKEIERIKCEGAIVRSRAQYAVEGEKSTAFFLNLEKRKQNQCYLQEIKDKEGKVVTNLVDILETVKTFYSDLFKTEGSDIQTTNEILEKMSAKLNDEDKLMCEQEITEKDIECAINQMTSNKSPGSDGLTANFYKAFCNVLKPILLKLYNTMEREQKVPESMTLGLITLIFKKGKKDELTNYRPITLLNNDYKILMKIFANRVKQILHTIIEPTQAYSVPGREVTDTVCTIRDVVEYLKETGQPGILLALDFNKAFDRVEHQFMFNVLKKVGFGNRFIQWVKLLYSKATGKVKCNGVITDAFPLERSVRQGCPLSSILYTIIAEPLGTLLKKDKYISGIELPGGGSCVVQQFADDTTLTVKNMASIDRAIEVINMYGRASGSRINVGKSEIMFINTAEPQQENIPFKIQSKHIKILGTYIGKDVGAARDLSWTEIINKIEKCLNYWKLRELKLKGRVVVLNNLILSKLNYALAVIELPLWVLNRINEIITNFLWRAKVSKIARKTLIGKYREGGLQLVDLESKKRAFRIKTVKKYLCDSTAYGWKSLMAYFINKVFNIGDFVLLMQLKRPMMAGLPGFYREVLSAHAEFLEHIDYTCDSINVIREMPIFLNKKINKTGKLLYNDKMLKAGLIQLKDIMYELVPGFLPPQAIYDNIKEIDYNVKMKEITNYYNDLKESIPKEWQTIIKQRVVRNREGKLPAMLVEQGGEWKSINSLKSKQIYEKFLVQASQRPTSLPFWGKVMPNLNVGQIWGQWRVRGNSLEAEDNDYKIRHNKVFTNVILHQFDRGVGRECDICGLLPETLMHMYRECSELTSFFETLKECLVNKLGLIWDRGDSWDVFFIFGVWEKSRVKNVALCKFLLSHARWAVKSRRNIAHFEGRIISVWNIFKSIVKKQIHYRLTHGAADFTLLFIKDSDLLSLNRRGEIVWNW